MEIVDISVNKFQYLFLACWPAFAQVRVLRLDTPNIDLLMRLKKIRFNPSQMH